MTGQIARICIAQEKSPVKVHPKDADILVFVLACLGAFPGGVLVMLVNRRLEIEA